MDKIIRNLQRCLFIGKYSEVFSFNCPNQLQLIFRDIQYHNLHVSAHFNLYNFCRYSNDQCYKFLSYFQCVSISVRKFLLRPSSLSNYFLTDIYPFLFDSTTPFYSINHVKTIKNSQSSEDTKQTNLLRPTLADATSVASLATEMPIGTRQSQNNENHNHNDNNNQDDIKVELRSRLTHIHLNDDHKLIDESFDDIKETKLDSELGEILVMKQKGYKLLHKMRNTLQGAMYKAQRIKDGLICAIKATSKVLHGSRTSEQDGMSIIVEENILLEAIILHHLTVANTSVSGDYIVQFIDFFEDESNYYLIMEYVNGVTLRDFTKKCHQMIQTKKLKLNHYKKICKYIFWQICCNINWLHNDINCAHLDLNMDNIMIENGTFIKNEEDDTISINPDINAKLIDFGLSEIFNVNINSDSPFLCSKHGMTNNQTYVSPKVFDGDVYDGRCADMWSLGIILFTLCVGTEPYTYPNDKTDAGYA